MQFVGLIRIVAGRVGESGEQSDVVGVVDDLPRRARRGTRIEREQAGDLREQVVAVVKQLLLGGGGTSDFNQNRTTWVNMRRMVTAGRSWAMAISRRRCSSR